MRNVIILLFILLCTSCSKIVGVDYELLDQGTVTEITKTVSDEIIKVKIVSANDSVCRQWQHFFNVDDLSAWLLKYTEHFNVGDFVYVYNDNGTILISKISTEDANIINQALSDKFWNEELSFWVIALLFISAILIAISLYKNSFGVFIAAVTTFFIVFSMVGLNKKLELFDQGEISQVDYRAEKPLITLNNSASYFINSMTDIMYSSKQLEKGDKVFVYLYNGEYIVSTKSLNPQTMKKTQCYPEKLLSIIGIYIGLVVFFFILSFCITAETS